MKLLGNKDIFAFEIGEKQKGEALLQVNIYIDGKNVCCDDNTVYLPQFYYTVKSTSEYLKKKIDYCKYEKYFWGKSTEEAHKWIESTNNENSAESNEFSDDIWKTYRFMSWGPTTDNVTCFLIPIHGTLYLTYRFWRETHTPIKEIEYVFGVEVTPFELIQVCEMALKILEGFLKDLKYEPT
jgi:hypothetical protein